MSATGMDPPPTPSRSALRPYPLVARLLRIWIGAVWLSNGLAKTLHVPRIDLGFYRASLIDLDSARSILTHATAATPIRPLAAVYTQIAGPAWPVFAPLLTVAELAIGVAMLTGLAVRTAAALGLLLIGPIWIMTWAGGGYLWDYPADLIPLALLLLLPPPPRPRLIRTRRRQPRHVDLQPYD